MKKILALVIIFTMFSMSNVFAADTPNLENSTFTIGDTEQDGESDAEDSLKEKYHEYSKKDDEEWERMGNKDLVGNICSDTGSFQLTGLLNELFFNVKGMLPGDKVTKYIRIKNTSNIDYDLTFEVDRKKSPGEGKIDLFDVLNLEIRKTDGERVELIYKGRIFDPQINQKTFKLGTIKVDQKPIMLQAIVTMDRNAGAEYKNQSEEVEWIFKAYGDVNNSEEPDNPSNIENSNIPENSTSNQSNLYYDSKENGYATVDLGNYSGKGKYAKTGDNNYLIYTILACGSLAIGCVLFFKNKRNNKEQDR